jgi:pyruvate formate lyase activating enzyme
MIDGFDIGGFIKVDSVNYPSLLACTIFTRGCNFRCPYCHNPGFVVALKSDSTPLNAEFYSSEEILAYIKQRRGLLDAIVVSGGEPCMQKGLKEFLTQVKALGLKTKLDTNGSFPQVLEDLLNSKLVDYVAMDLKTSWDKYLLLGFDKVELVKKSVELVFRKAPDYEFRTTCVKPIVEPEDFASLGLAIKGAKKYYLQTFKNSVTFDVSYHNASSYSEEELKEQAVKLREFVEFVGVR